jgi:hypothetical protein
MAVSRPTSQGQRIPGSRCQPLPSTLDP